MSRDTIDFGIDLGTTNSVISVADGGKIDVIKNGLHEITPSVIYIDKKSRSTVGHSAAQNLTRVTTALDVQAEFKREMGTAASRTFKGSGIEKTVVELSSMVLEDLRKAAAERFGDPPNAAVITIPAMFELPQRDATARAATEAGFEHAILLQEPVAAASAYGFSSDSDKAYWLVYDFGGGTFDASMVSVRDGQLTVVEHAGDNYLGGADLDRILIDTFIVPALREEYDLDDLKLENMQSMPAVAGKFAVLKTCAEDIKKELSRESDCAYYRENIFEDDSGDPVDCELDITRADFEDAIRARVDRSIEITKDLIKDCGLSAADIEKVLLVGGTTFVPLVQQKVENLGIPVDRSMDPMTVVSYGAAVFASSQRIPKEMRQSAPVAAGTAQVELDYEPVGKDLNPPVGGKILINNAPPPAGISVSLARDDDGWKSGDLKVNSKGIFFTDVLLRDSGQSAFRIQVRDEQGVSLEVTPNQFAITYGLSVAKASLPSGLQIGLADGSCHMIFASGTSLPKTSEVQSVRTVADLKKGSQDALKIPILSGDEPIAELNLVGTNFVLTGTEIARDLPAGSEVQITAALDSSVTSEISFTIPHLDETFEVTQGSVTEHEAPAVMQNRLDSLRSRMSELVDAGQASGEHSAVSQVRSFQSSPDLAEIERLISLWRNGDSVSAGQARNLLVSATKKVHELAGLVEWPAKLTEYEEVKDTAKRSVHEFGDASDTSLLDSVMAEGEKAIQAKDPRMLDRTQNQLRSVHVQMLQKDPSFWAGMLQYLATCQSDFSDQARANQLLNEGAMAMRRGDVSSLQNICQQLRGMLPREVAAQAQGGLGSGVI